MLNPLWRPMVSLTLPIRLWVPAFCALLLAAAGAAQTPVTFLQPKNIGECQSPVTADFNGDGNLDVACAGSTLTIWLGDGQGHFHETAQQLPYYYALVVAGDFNGDGRTDLVVAASDYLRTSSQIVFLPGNGDGTFGVQTTIANTIVTALATIRPKPSGPLGLVAAVGEYPIPPYTVEVFPGNGDGTFQEPFPTGVNSDTNIAVADFNGDGIPDIASIGQYDNYAPDLLQVVLGNADGSFGPPVNTTVPATLAFAVADFNGDGILDVAWSNQNSIYVYQGNGDGTFSAGPVTTTQTGTVLLAADLNGDGRPDLVMAGMAIAINQGGGMFKLTEWYQNPSGNGGAAGDFRHRGLPDLIVAGDYYENSGSGTFHGPRSYPAGCGQCAYLALGDFNNDGNLDAAVAQKEHVLVYAGNGGGLFTSFRATAVTLPNQKSIGAVAAADFNGDGNLDLAIGTVPSPHNPAEVAILPGNGNGTFGTPIVAYSGGEVRVLAVADFNRSGHMGLAIGTNHDVVVMCGNSAGGFTTTATIQGISNSTSLVVADFNRDGIPDLATASDVFLGNGDGTFRHAYTLPETWNEVQTGDFNGDGIPDLATWDDLAGDIVYWPGLGDGTFGLPIAVSATGAQLAVVADLNGDGFSDIVTTTWDSSTATLYLGKGDGTFATEAVNNLPPTGNLPMAVGAFTNNGKPDLLFVSLISQLVLLINSTK